MTRKLPLITLLPLLAGLMIGCGSPGSPAPPSLNLPTPVLDLLAARTGDSVRLAWTMPKRTTDHLPLKRQVSVQVCRAVESAPCTIIATINLAPGGAGVYTDALSSDLTQGSYRLLHYEVALLNRAGKSAGQSNLAYSAAGPPPSAVNGLNWAMRPDGVLLSWTPAAEKSVFFRIERLQLTTPPPAEGHGSPLASSAPPAAQTLVVRVPDGADPGHAMDTSALFNQRYRYTLERVAALKLSGQSVEVQGLPSQAIEVATKDTFPPAVPQGLAAVADAATGAIDLSWTPDSDSDLAAYSIYRRDVQAGAPAKRIASVSAAPSFRDTGVEPGHTYAYSVSALDQSGNESKPCPEVEETLPRP
jgi:hypothetical protein